MNNIYLVPNDDGTYEAFASPVAPAENAALLVAEGEYPVECYYYRQDMNGDSILESSKYTNQNALIWGLNSHGLAFHTIRSLWDFDSYNGVTAEIGNIYDAARRKVSEIISLEAEETDLYFALQGVVLGDPSGEFLSRAKSTIRWAKSFNLKQAAQTLIYLQENKLLEYADLEKRTQAVTDRYHELATEIKSAEGRMAEIKTLQQQIINYSKTRGTYIAYRKAGYSPKFREEHEADIILHQSAKKYFDTLGIEKLPSVKSLQAEYSELLERKKKIYPEYRKKQAEMKELLTIKANVDRLLNMDIQPSREEQHEKHM